MILILSQSSAEPTTEDVIDWIQALGGLWLRVNGEDLDGDSEVSVELSAEKGEPRLRWWGSDLPLAEVRAVWFRRWVHARRHEQCDLLTGLSMAPKLHYQLCRHLTQEAGRFSDFFFQTFADRPWINRPKKALPNKLDVLRRAARVGLDIPATLVTSRREELDRFCAFHGRVITKPIGDVAPLVDRDEMFLMYTALVEPEALAGLPEIFSPSLFQECLDKEYELRVFYLDGESYAMAIFSQGDPQTYVDFRRYNRQKPNRRVPYRLEEQIADSICKLMCDLELESGSLDLIRTRDGRMVFLEVNPVGQFGMVSKPCNYNLERKLAEHLIARAQHAGQP
jgi:ATP-GRASP peptide maturase of grasp-with-spasm system